jgi:hypothetical protein
VKVGKLTSSRTKWEVGKDFPSFMCREVPPRLTKVLLLAYGLCSFWNNIGILGKALGQGRVGRNSVIDFPRRTPVQSTLLR